MKNTLRIFSLLAAFSLVSTSCSDNFFDVNTDPNNSPTSTVELTLPAGQSSIAFVLGDQWQILGSLWSQHWTQSTGANQYASIDDYSINENTYNAAYTELYAGALNDLQFVSKNAAETEDWNYFVIAELMKAYTFQMLVDFYDKVPYFEALQGTTDLTPKFDDGQAIYDDLITKIDAALAVDRTGSTVRQVGQEDLIFGGDMNQWIRFANTLKLKIYLRQSGVRENVAQAGIEALYASGAQFLDADAQYAAYTDVENFRNPFYATQISTAGAGRGYVDIAASATLLEYLQGNTDPRLDTLFLKPTANPTGPHAALAQGDYNNTTFVAARNLSQPFIRAVQPVVLIGRAESKFLQAEAIERFGVAGDAKDLYQQGIAASLTKLGLGVPGHKRYVDPESLYGDGAVYDYDSGEDHLKLIITQKWISMANFQGAEAHLETKRTGYPDFFTEPPNNVTSGAYPRRLPYPSTELDNNREELSKVGGQKQVTVRVWWNPL